MNVFGEDGRTVLAEIPSSGEARCAASDEKVGDEGGVSLFVTTYGEVTGLPESMEGTMYIVSLLVRQALPERTDLASPGKLLRDADGRPVGCIGLSVNR